MATLWLTGLRCEKLRVLWKHEVGLNVLSLVDNLNARKLALLGSAIGIVHRNLQQFYAWYMLKVLPNRVFAPEPDSSAPDCRLLCD